ncbi:MAG: hypothetical protein ACI8PT_001741, partial [Gammaproteobacteria bacterium]
RIKHHHHASVSRNFSPIKPYACKHSAVFIKGPSMNLAFIYVFSAISPTFSVFRQVNQL